MNRLQNNQKELKTTDALLFAYAIQLITPIPFLPGLPLPIIGLILFFIVLFKQQDTIGTLSSFVRIILAFFCFLLAAGHNDVLLRFALCLISFLILRIESYTTFYWYLLWFMYQLVINLITPSQYVIRWIADGFSYASWAIGFGWVIPTTQFLFGPDIAQVHLFLLWLFFFLATTPSVKQIKFGNLLPILLSLLIIFAELNYLNAAFSDFNIQIVSLINFILFPLIFLFQFKLQKVK